MSVLKKISVVGAVGLVGIAGIVPTWGQDNLNQQANQAQLTVDPQTGYFGINQRPWFSNSAVRQHLQWNDDQYNQLSQRYDQSWNSYNTGLTGLENNLTAQQRMQRRQELNGRFHTDFSKSFDGVITDPAAQQRYNQLNWQYRGYGAFSDPAVQQKLNLTNEQRHKFGNYHNEWNQQMNTWNRDYATDRDGVTSRFNNSRKEYQDRVNTTLNPQQQQMWSEMSGKPYTFPADVYFQSGTSTNSTLKPVLK